jgi:GNAT superfamily N-acetyltransferase
MVAVFQRARGRAMPWLPVLHSPDEDLVFFASEVATSAGWVAQQETGAVGGFALARDGWLNHMYVEPGCHGLGAGTALLSAACLAFPLSLQLWVFERNERARSFYCRHGFVEVELTDGSHNEEGVPDVRMARAAQAGSTPAAS